MRILLTLLVWLWSSPDDGRTLGRYGRMCTFRGAPNIHFIVATEIGIEYRLDPALLLSIARHESCFDNRVRTGRAVGVMQTITAMPATLADGYEYGAQELRAWLKITRGDLRTALSGYSGGFAVLRACRSGGDCGYADVFLRGARELRRSRHGR